MRVIWKFPLAIQEADQTLRMPRGAHVLHVREQNGTPTIWALCDDAEPIGPRGFVTIPTGAEFKDGQYWYCGTAFCGPFVWHVFEVCE